MQLEVEEKSMSNERKTIFITGGASGMGEATARLFAENGWFVGIYDVNEEGLKALASELGPDNCMAAKLDVTDRPAYKSALQEFEETAGGRLDVMFNNAGIIKVAAFSRMDLADFERIVQVNFMGVVNGIHLAHPLLKKTPNSLCFITSSSAAIFGSAALAAYSSSKYALRGLTEALSVEFAVDDIRVADTWPGHVQTGMMVPEFAKSLPKEGPWRVVPSKAVADVVWASYHDKGGKLHWFVPEDLKDYYLAIVDNVEAERNARRDRYVEAVKKYREAKKK
jgi:NAD(P)-dependent dehydrogenase (short-subunit alcohol dehydrogenase family)